MALRSASPGQLTGCGLKHQRQHRIGNVRRITRSIDRVRIETYVGQALTPEKFAQLQADILAVVLTEPDVQRVPPPNITYQADQNSFLSATIQYVYKPTGQTRAITAP